MKTEQLKDWSKNKFKELLSERKEKKVNDGKYPLYSLTIENGVSPKSDRYNREFLVSNKDEKKYKVVYPNDLVFNPANLRWGAIARSKVNFPVLVSPIYEVLYPKENDKIDQLYLDYLSHSDHMHIQYLHYMEGTLVERTALKIDDFLELEPNLPPLLEQQKIASILTSVDDVIEKTQSQINKLQDLKKGTMNELLTRGIGHTEFVDSPVGKIPKGWEVKQLGELVRLQRGHDLTSKQMIEGQYPVVSSSGISGYHNQSTTKGPCVVIGRKGSIGSVHYIETDLWAHDTSLYAKEFIGTNEKFIYYLCVWLDLQRFGTKSGSPSLNRNDIHPIKIATPPFSEQMKIASFLSSIDKNIKEKRKKLEQTKSLKKSLMQDLLTGKVRVTLQ